MRTYGQYCAVAKALDVVGDRWTLLIVRELTVQGPCRYTDIAHGLPGIASNLLSDRLRDLEEAGIVEREAAPPPVATTLYRLTRAGQELGTGAAGAGPLGRPVHVRARRRRGVSQRLVGLPHHRVPRGPPPAGPPAPSRSTPGTSRSSRSATGRSGAAGPASDPDLVLRGPAPLVWRAHRENAVGRCRRAGLEVTGDITVLDPAAATQRINRSSLIRAHAPRAGAQPGKNGPMPVYADDPTRAPLPIFVPSRSLRPWKIATVVLALALVAVLALIAQALADQSGAGAPPVSAAAGTASDGASPASTGSGAQETAKVDALVAQSASYHQAVVTAITQIGSCTSPSSAAASLSSTADQREQLAGRLATVDWTTMAGGGALEHALDAALRASATSDRDYATWGQDVAASGCAAGQSVAHDGAYAAAQASDATASAAKTQFVSAWNPLAASYGLPARQAAGL